MFKSIICGRSNFHKDDDQERLQWSPSSTPKKSSSNGSTPRKLFSNFSAPKKSSSKSISSRNSTPKKNTTSAHINPYSNRGLDKFATVLSELEEKRQVIYQQVSPKDIDVVGFTYSIPKDCWVPIVVKAKDEKQEKSELHVHIRTAQKSETLEDKSPSPSIEMFKEEPKPGSEKIQMKKKMIFDMGKWRRPSSYWPLMLIAFILFSLVVFGRSFAIVFTAVFWYLKALLKGEEGILNKRSSMKKKESMRKMMMINGDGYSYPKSKNLELGSSPQK